MIGAIHITQKELDYLRASHITIIKHSEIYISRSSLVSSEHGIIRKRIRASRLSLELIDKVISVKKIGEHNVLTDKELNGLLSIEEHDRIKEMKDLFF